MRFLPRLVVVLLSLAPLAASGQTITATQTDNTPQTTRKLQGDTIDYTTVITNSGAVNATGVTLTNPTPTNTTDVGTPHASPIAFADVYTAVGNTKLYVGTTPPAGEPAAVLVSTNGVLANDTIATSPDTIVLTAGTIPTSGGGSVVLNANGTFTYTPAAGFTGTDTFTYTIKNSAVATLTDVGTVTITVGPRVWYVKSGGTNGNGTSTSPFSSFAPLTADGVNDTIYVYKGTASYTAVNLTLKAGETLQGESADLVVSGYTLRTAVPANTPTLGATTGTVVTLAASNTVKNLVVNNAGGAGIVGTSVGVLTLADLAVTSNGGAALSATTGTSIVATGTNTLSATNGTGLFVSGVPILAGNLLFASISSTGSPTGIYVDNTGTAGGLIVTGDGVNTTRGGNGSGGTISGKTSGADGTVTAGIGIYLSNTAKASISRVTVTNSSNYGVRVVNSSDIAFRYCTVSGAHGDNTALREGSVIINNLLGTNSIGDSIISGSVEDNVRVENASGTLTAFNLTNSTIQNNSSTSGNIGFRFAVDGSGASSTVMNGTVSGCTFTGNRTDAINCDASLGTVNVTILNNQIYKGSPNPGNIGINVTVANSGVLTHAIESNTIGKNGGTDAPLLNTGINVFNGTLATASPASISGTVKNNVVANDNTTAAGTSNGFGIRLFNQGYGTMAANVAGNTVTNVNTDYGIFVEVSSSTANAAASGTTTVAVVGNTASVKSGGLDAIRVQARGRSTVNARIKTNTAPTFGSGFFGLEIRQANQTVSGTTYTATFNLEGLATGLQSNATTIKNNLNSQNPAIPVAACDAIFVTGITGVTSVNGIPPLLLAPTAEGTFGATAPDAFADPIFQDSLPAAAPAALAATPGSQPAAVSDLTQEELDRHVVAALARWEAAGLAPEHLALLRELRWEISSLAGRHLGQADGKRMLVSPRGAGQGWFIDPNPASDAAFARPFAATRRFAAPEHPAAGRVDLLTAILHEMGHPLGLDDTYQGADRAGLMFGYLGKGERRLPTAADVAAVRPGMLERRPHFLASPISIGTLPAGKSVTIVWTVQINNPVAAGTTQISSQGTVSGSNFASVVTDDPDAAGANNPTVTLLGIPPVITSGNATTFTVGTAGSFQVTATGVPAPTFSFTGTLPSGVTLTSAGVLSGTPAANTGGIYAISITASNGVSPNATQSFTLTVNQAPAITSANTTTFTAGTLGSFTVTTTGFPQRTISQTGTLPQGVSFVDNGNGTATLSGTATAAGSYPITITAANGVLPNATQSFTLVVVPGAATSLAVSAPASATAGSAFSVTVTARDQFGNTATGYRGTVHFTTTDAAAGASVPANYTFTAGDNGAHTFANGATLVTAGSQMITATDTVNATITGTSSAITVNAAAATRYTVSAPASATAGAAFNFTVTALDQFNNVATGYAGTVRFTSTDAAATLPANSTLANGVGTFSATLKTAGVRTITATDTVTSSITGTSNSITVSAAAATRYSVSAPSSATAGVAFNYTVSALDQFNNVATGYAGTVRFTSTDGAATLPANSTLTNGVGTFSATLKTAGSQTITATDTVNATITGTSGSISVSAAAATRYALSAPASATAGVAFNFTVSALDQFNNVATGYAGTVRFTSTDGAATLPANSTLTNGVGTFSATLKTAGSQTITATDTVNATITGASNSITVSAAAATRYTVSAPASATASAAFNFTVTALDQFNNTATGYAGTVRFTSSDSAATLPANSTLASGVGTFSATLRTSGGQTITATDTVTSSITGTSNTINVSGSAPAITSANTATFTVGQSNTFTVTTSGTPTPALSETGALPSGVSFTDNGNGTATLSGNPATGSNPSYVITITANNGVNPNATQSFTLVINRRPVVNNDTLGAKQNTPVSAPKAKLLANDSDPDGDALSIVSVAPTSAQGGTVTLNATSVIYTPATDFVGSDSFSYTVSDGRGGMASASVSVTVTAADASTLDIVSITMEPGGVRVVAQGIPGLQYQFQYSSSLTPATWTNVGPPQVASSTGRFEYLDPANPPPAQRFYRVVFVPPQ